MKQPSLTYGQLAEKLKALGYRQQVVEVNGKPGQVFEHERVSGAMIILPQRDPQDVVEPPYLNKVLLTLKSRGLIEEPNPLLM